MEQRRDHVAALHRVMRPGGRLIRSVLPIRDTAN
ncbi:hypothetical protein ACIHDR_44415 [Nocardia sp. NPDC052278]